MTGFSEPEFLPLADAFTKRMAELGWTDRQDIIIDVRTAAGDYTRLTNEAGELVSSKVDLIVAMGTPGATAVLKHSRTIPVVFTLVADPVAQGFIDNLARPGGNLTGFTNFEFSIAGKWLEMAREIDPRVERLTLLANPANPNTDRFISAFENAGALMRVTISPVRVSTVTEIAACIAAAARDQNNALFVLPDSLAVVHRTSIIELAERHRVTALYAFRAFPVSGGLMSYGLDYGDMYRQTANYTNRILRGTNPADLPVQAPNKFELVINLKTARALGLHGIALGLHNDGDWLCTRRVSGWCDCG